MTSFSLFNSYSKYILRYPKIVLLAVFLITAFFAYHAPKFQLDASGDSLVLENDKSLKYYRSIKARYGSDDFLIITYTPKDYLFSDKVLEDVKKLRNSLKSINRVDSVVSILDVPLINSPPVGLTDLMEGIRTLETKGVDSELAKKEFLSSPLYNNLIISSDGTTTALQVNFKQDDTYRILRKRRDFLRSKQLNTDLSPGEKKELELVSRRFKEYSKSLLEQQDRDIEKVREIMDQHRGVADLYLGGVPMIVADSIDYIRSDLMTFGVAVLCLLIMILAVAFGKLHWVILPMVNCTLVGISMIGFLGLVKWPVTVVSSNFISLLLIITLSLTVHLIVRYRELYSQAKTLNQYKLVSDVIRKMAHPCFYTSLTTIVAFGSLLVSDIRPIIDFGWMMTIGIVISFIFSFTFFPSALLLMDVEKSDKQSDFTGAITTFFAKFIKAHKNLVLGVFGTFFVLSIWGLGFLTVENRFIDYYKKDTEIYQGMELIDSKLGGTTPLDVVIDAPDDFFAYQEEDTSVGSAGIVGSSYWYNTFSLEEVDAIHGYLDDLPETGKVMSISTAMRMLKSLKGQGEIDSFYLAILYEKLPKEIKDILFSPYMSEDGNQIRFSIRVFESDKSLKRNELLEKIKTDLVDKFGLKEEQVKTTGMLVLYNNMLQSLFRSQILTFGVVFLAIMTMFAISFRNAKVAMVAIIPNIVASAFVLGLMGWANIPLDIMTITIAAICIGIAVDNTIHYVHRFTIEFKKDGDYWASVKRAHGSIGRAMYYTAVTITLGFSILAFSNFIPTIYFGLLTGLSMVVALLADIALLPLLIVVFKPLGKGS